MSQEVMNELASMSLEIIKLKDSNRELLAALKRIRDCYSSSHSSATRQNCWEQVSAAIAKAEGEQK